MVVPLETLKYILVTSGETVPNKSKLQHTHMLELHLATLGLYNSREVD